MLELRGALRHLQASLASAALSYVPPKGFNGTDHVLLVANDQGNCGATATSPSSSSSSSSSSSPFSLTANLTIPITVAPVNDAPVLNDGLGVPAIAAGPGSSDSPGIQAGALVSSATLVVLEDSSPNPLLPALTLRDVDQPTDLALVATASVLHGTLSLADMGMGSAAAAADSRGDSGDSATTTTMATTTASSWQGKVAVAFGHGQRSVTLVGLVNDVGECLAALKYAPNLDFNGVWSFADSVDVVSGGDDDDDVAALPLFGGRPDLPYMSSFSTAFSSSSSSSPLEVLNVAVTDSEGAATTHAWRVSVVWVNDPPSWNSPPTLTSFAPAASRALPEPTLLTSLQVSDPDAEEVPGARLRVELSVASSSSTTSSFSPPSGSLVFLDCPIAAALQDAAASEDAYAKAAATALAEASLTDWSSGSAVSSSDNTKTISSPNVISLLGPLSFLNEALASLAYVGPSVTSSSSGGAGGSANDVITLVVNDLGNAGSTGVGLTATATVAVTMAKAKTGAPQLTRSAAAAAGAAPSLSSMLSSTSSSSSAYSLPPPSSSSSLLAGVVEMGEGSCVPLVGLYVGDAGRDDEDVGDGSAQEGGDNSVLELNVTATHGGGVVLGGTSLTNPPSSPSFSSFSSSKRLGQLEDLGGSDLYAFGGNPIQRIVVVSTSVAAHAALLPPSPSQSPSSSKVSSSSSARPEVQRVRTSVPWQYEVQRLDIRTDWGLLRDAHARDFPRQAASKEAQGEYQAQLAELEVELELSLPQVRTRQKEMKIDVYAFGVDFKAHA